MIRLKPMATLALLIAGLIFATSAQARLLYSITDLGTLGGDTSVGFAINGSGQVSGWASTATGSASYHAFVASTNGPMLDLGTLGGDYSAGYGINASGQVTGFANPRAFVTDSSGKMAELEVLGGAYGSGYAINDSGQVAGTFKTATGPTHAFVTDNGQMVDLGTLGGNSSEGAGINASGQVTGSADDVDGNAHAFVTNSSGTMVDLGTFGGHYSAGAAINASGLVTGYANLTNDVYHHAFVTDSSGKMLDLGTLVGGLSSNGTGINDAKQVVGSADIYIFNNESHAFVTDAHGKMQDLNSLLLPGTAGWKLTNAMGINNAGQITGFGLHDGVLRAFLLTPVAGFASKANGDIVRFSETQNDQVKCGPLTKDPFSTLWARVCYQNTTGAYSVTVKLSAATLKAYKVAIDQLNQNTPWGITTGTFAFSGTLADADPNKTHLPPVNLPGTWTQQHTVCARYNAEGGCLLYKLKPVIDDKVIISADKKHNLIFNLSGKKSVVEGADKGQQIYASLCQTSSLGKSQQTENMSISIGEIIIPLAIQINCNVTWSNKMPSYSTAGPFELNNMAIKAVLNSVQ